MNGHDVTDNFIARKEVGWALHREVYDDLPIVLQMTIEGEPVSKARARFTHKGYKTHAYTPERTRHAEEQIAQAAKKIVPAPDGTIAFGLFAKFFCGTWQRRDVDNMLKLVSDSLNGIIWADDAQVSEMSASVQRGVENAGTHILVYQTRASMPPTNPCQVCSKPVRQYKSQPNKYCSKACSGKGQQRRVPLVCLTCGSAYELPHYRAVRVKKPYCSEQCRIAAHRVDSECANCGKSVSRPLSQTKAHIFCGKPCSNAWKIGRPRGGA